MLLEVLYLLLFVTSVLGGSSPNGKQLLERSYREGRLLADDISEDANLDVIGLLIKYGYPSETHVVQTEDGYLLTLHRISRGKEKKRSDKPAVLLMHGILSSSADWINSGPDTGLGYLLADEGFDVWMGNARGNFYSRHHISLNPNDSKFWKFSWNEIGFYDLPAMINRILKETGQDKLHYIGHSQGSTIFFVMASLRPEFNSKIKSMQALSPVTYMSNLKSPLVKYLAPFASTIETVASWFGVNEFLPNNELMTTAANLLCTDGSWIQPVCSNILFLFCGYTELLNSTILPVYLGHTPAGSSSRQMVHYTQLYRSGKFRKYDYGFFGNLARYGSRTPPDYPLERITAPVALHYSYNDWMSHPTDVFQLWTELSNPIGLFPVRHKTFNHLDFMWAINVRELLYSEVLHIMKKYN